MTTPWAPAGRVAEAAADLASGPADRPVDDPPRPLGILDAPPIPLPSLELPLPERPSYSSLEVVGQVLDTYLVCQDGGRMVLIDQHAAAERVTFEQMRSSWRKGGVTGQLLLVPVRADLDPGRAALVEENEGLLRAFGLVAELSGPDSVTIREIPLLVAHADPARLLQQVLDELEGASGRVESVAEQVLSTMACHGSVRGGDVMDEARIRALLEALDEVDWAAHCPHGRPVSFVLTREELERRFGR
jgi:DNA mismatch repair protein MutL